MATDVATRRAGQFALDRFRTRRKAWLRRVWWIFPLVAVFQVALVVGFAAVFQPERMSFFLGLGVGIAFAMVAVLADSPPHHVERWRQGAQGERATARALRPLTKAGWVVLHDLEGPRGNTDHVLVGPAGVFLLESKHLSGMVSIERGVLRVRWREDPGDGYENRWLGARVRAAAAHLSETLDGSAESRVWVQPLVVLWAAFEQRSVLSDGVAWVRGNELAKVLARRPARLSAGEISHISGEFTSRFRSPST
jgi:hypothetical protein